MGVQPLRAFGVSALVTHTHQWLTVTPMACARVVHDRRSASVVQPPGHHVVTWILAGSIEVRLNPMGYMVLSAQPLFSSMEKALWYLIAGTRGGENRAKIIRQLDERPKNANQLAAALDIKYNTVRHHLDMLLDHDVIEEGEQDYGKLYFLSDEFEEHREMFESIIENVS